MYALIGETLSGVRWVDRLAAEFVAAIRTPFLTEMMTSMTGLGSVTAGVVFVGLFYLSPAGARSSSRASSRSRFSESSSGG